MRNYTLAAQHSGFWIFICKYVSSCYRSRSRFSLVSSHLPLFGQDLVILALLVLHFIVVLLIHLDSCTLNAKIQKTTRKIRKISEKIGQKFENRNEK